MSKDKDKKIARANAWSFEMAVRERAAKKAAKSERDAKAKREKRVAMRLARQAAEAAGVVAASVDDGTAFCVYVAAPHDTGESWDAENMRYEHGRLPAAPCEFVTWTKQDVAQVLGQA